MPFSIPVYFAMLRSGWLIKELKEQIIQEDINMLLSQAKINGFGKIG
jgi:hypothetical protein